MKTFLVLALLALAPLAPATTQPEPITVETPLVVLSFVPPQAPANVGAFQVDPSGPVMSTSWTSAGPLGQNVKTPRRVGEGSANQAKRHQYAVQAQVALFPPIPGPA